MGSGPGYPPEFYIHGNSIQKLVFKNNYGFGLGGGGGPHQKEMGEGNGTSVNEIRTAKRILLGFRCCDGCWGGFGKCICFKLHLTFL